MSERVTIERNVEIQAGVPSVAVAIYDFHRWMDWSPFEGLDPDLKRSYSGPESGLGSRYTWDGNRKAGAGSMSVTAVSDNSVGVDVNFLRPFKSESASIFTFAPTTTGTIVSWRMSFEKTVASRIMGLFFPYEKTLAPELAKGLAKLKVLLETQELS